MASLTPCACPRSLGLLRLGFLDAVLSRALLRGFMTAVGIVIFCAQAIPILGLEHAVKHAHASIDTPFQKIAFTATHLGDTRMLTCVISASALAFLILTKLFKKKLAERPGMRVLKFVPEVLFVVIGSTILSSVFDWDSKGVAVLGKVSAGQASFVVPFTYQASYLQGCLGTSTVVAVLGFLDSIVAAKDCAGRFDYPISPNRELVALGAANFGAAFVSGTLPGFGSVTRSRLAGQTGATTQMVSRVEGGAGVDVVKGLTQCCAGAGWTPDWVLHLAGHVLSARLLVCTSQVHPGGDHLRCGILNPRGGAPRRQGTPPGRLALGAHFRFTLLTVPVVRGTVLLEDASVD